MSKIFKTFDELEAYYLPNDSFWLRIGYESRQEEIDELKKQIEKMSETIDRLKYCYVCKKFNDCDLTKQGKTQSCKGRFEIKDYTTS